MHMRAGGGGVPHRARKGADRIGRERAGRGAAQEEGVGNAHGGGSRRAGRECAGRERRAWGGKGRALRHYYRATTGMVLNRYISGAVDEGEGGGQQARGEVPPILKAREAMLGCDSNDMPMPWATWKGQAGFCGVGAGCCEVRYCRADDGGGIDISVNRKLMGRRRYLREARPEGAAREAGEEIRWKGERRKDLLIEGGAPERTDQQAPARQVDERMHREEVALEEWSKRPTFSSDGDVKDGDIQSHFPERGSTDKPCSERGGDNWCFWGWSESEVK
ncbi:hypothetical protein B0H10DRAFT_1953706 [Mycena sp. CBHHK59/15]|nr:hypothetical protein B0H10DRAFT_1953706 [Mycena sp. CBHHK59/15]